MILNMILILMISSPW